MGDVSRDREPIWSSVQEYGRGVAGGLLFSLPLLYTMEVWWTGFLADSRTLLICVCVTFLLLLGYNRYGGIRAGVRFLDVAIDSVEEFGLGILLATLVLFLLDRITPAMPLNEILGKIIIESMLVSIGVSVGTAELGLKNHLEEQNDQELADRSERPVRGTSSMAKHVVLSFCGAVLFACNIAPTEEVVVIAVQSPTWKLIGLVVLSLTMGALIQYFSGFYQSKQFFPAVAISRGVLVVASTYAIALIASAMLLGFFQRFDEVSPAIAVSEVVVLGFASNLGASAGRLLIE